MSNLKLFNQTITNPATQKYLQEVLNEKKASFVNNLVSAVANDEKLQQCEPTTIMFAALKATALSLPIENNLGFCYLIPYKDNKKGTTVCQFQVGTKGFIQLAQRSGLVVNIDSKPIYDGQIIDDDNVFGGKTIKWSAKKSDTVIGWAGYIELNNGFSKTLFMTNEELKKHGLRFSQTYKKGYGLWVDDFDSMASKTVIKMLLSKYAPLSVEIQNAVKYDQSVITEKGVEYIDNTEVDDAKNANNEKVAKIFNEAFGKENVENTDFETVTDEDIDEVETKLENAKTELFNE